MNWDRFWTAMQVSLVFLNTSLLGHHYGSAWSLYYVAAIIFWAYIAIGRIKAGKY